jgi:hypothetical protein
MGTHKEKLAIIKKYFESGDEVYGRTQVNVLLEEISLLEAEVERLKESLEYCRTQARIYHNTVVALTKEEGS